MAEQNLGERMDRLEQGQERMAGDISQIKRALLGNLDRPGGLAKNVADNTRRLDQHEQMLKAQADTIKALGDWIQDRTTIERFGKWFIGGGGVAIGTLVGWLLSLAAK